MDLHTGQTVDRERERGGETWKESGRQRERVETTGEESGGSAH